MDINNDTVSIIIPMFNSERTIESCLSSAQEQTYNNLEIIVVDDGSEDESFAICKKLAESDSRINLISCDGNGVSAARNTGIKQSSGSYIFFLDSDDHIKPDTIKLAVEAIKESNAQMVMVDYFRLSESGNSPHNFLPDSCVFSEYDDSIEWIRRASLIPESGVGFAWGKLFNSDFIKSNGLFFDETLVACEDAEFMFRCLVKMSVAGYINFHGYIYVLSSSSTVHTLRSDYVKRYVKALKTIRRYINNNPELYIYLETYYSCVLYHLLLCAVNYSFHPSRTDSTEHQIRQFKKLCSTNIFKEALRHIHLNDFSASRKATLLLIKNKMYHSVKLIAKIRNKNRK